MTSRISAAYDSVAAITGPRYLEPLPHVEQVHKWRQQFRPKQVRLLIIAESHVRGKDKPGFIYDAAYYTRWWRDLLVPAFGSGITREGLTERGIWILDMSVIALSGYRKLYPESSNRPFDGAACEIFAASWMHYVKREFEDAECRQIVYFDRVKSMLPASTGTPLKFCVPSNSTRYANPDYGFGTARFIDAVRAAGL